jgi:CheY-like chemotaxis protein
MAKILVIDDEQSMRDVLNQMLTRDGHTVTTAIDGVDGIRVFKQFNPDLVITDIIMPNKDGIEVITELLGKGSHAAILAISGGRRAITAEFNLESAELLGVKGILSKPFTHDQLRDVVQHALA